MFPVDSNAVFYFCRFDFCDYFISYKFFREVQKIHDLYTDHKSLVRACQSSQSQEIGRRAGENDELCHWVCK